MSFGIINHKVKEYREGDLAILEVVITFFGIPIYRHRKTTTNIKVVASLTIQEKKPQIVGFTNNN